MFRASHAHHREKKNCINTASGNCHSVLVAVSCAGWEFTGFFGTPPPSQFPQARRFTTSSDVVVAGLIF